MNKNYALAFGILCFCFQAEAMKKEIKINAEYTIRHKHVIWWNNQYEQLVAKQKELLQQNIACTSLSDKEVDVAKTLFFYYMADDDNAPESVKRANYDVAYILAFGWNCTKEIGVKYNAHSSFIKYLTQKDWSIDQALQMSIAAAQKQ